MSETIAHSLDPYAAANISAPKIIIDKRGSARLDANAARVPQAMRMDYVTVEWDEKRNMIRLRRSFAHNPAAYRVVFSRSANQAWICMRMVLKRLGWKFGEDVKLLAHWKSGELRIPIHYEYRMAGAWKRWKEEKPEESVHYGAIWQPRSPESELKHMRYHKLKDGLSQAANGEKESDSEKNPG